MGFAVDNVLLFFLLKSTHDVLSVRDCSKLAFSNVVQGFEEEQVLPSCGLSISEPRPPGHGLQLLFSAAPPSFKWGKVVGGPWSRILPFSYLDSQRQLEMGLLLLHVRWSRLFPFTQVP